MDDSIRQISNESFSYGWLNNMKPSFDRLGESLRRSFDALDSTFFIEMDPDFFSMRWTDSRGFHFNLPSCDSSALIHADQIFPMHLANPEASDSVLTRSLSLDSSKRLLSQSSRWDDSNSTDSSPNLSSGANKLGHSKKSPGRILRKYLYFLIPLYKKVKGLKMISRSSPRMVAFSSADRRRDNRVFDMESESSIRDAVLHCKRSIAGSAGGEM